MAKSIKFDDKEYAVDDLSDVARKMLDNVRMADARLVQLTQEAAMVKLARDVYAKTLQENLPRPAAGAEAAGQKH